MLRGAKGVRYGWSSYTPNHARPFITLPDFTSSQPSIYTEKKVLPYRQQDLYKMVADVNKYSEFLPYCTHSRILASKHTDLDTPNVIEAELGVGFKGFEERYTSVVNLQPFESVTARASSQTPLFKSLQTTYRFTPQSDSHTQLSIELEYAFVNPIYASLSSTFFDGVSQAMVTAFEQRARMICKPLK